MLALARDAADRVDTMDCEDAVDDKGALDNTHSMGCEDATDCESDMACGGAPPASESPGPALCTGGSTPSH